MKAFPLLAAAALPALALAACSPMGPEFNPRATGAAKQDTTSTAKFSEVNLGAKIAPEDLRPPTEPFRLGAGDVLDVEILDAPDSRQICTVMPDGTLFYQAVPGVEAAGLTLPELKAKLEEGLKPLYSAPVVSVNMREVNSKRVWVLGRLNYPGLLPIFNELTALEAISRAGGLFVGRFGNGSQELADLEHSFLVRKGEFVPVDFYKLIKEGDMSQNVYLKNGDYIFIPSALSKEVYVLGAVHAPHDEVFLDQITLAEAIAQAGGLRPNAYAHRVVIVRGSLLKPQVALVDFTDIYEGKATNILLEPHDIVWVPYTPWERVERYAKEAITTFVQTAASNEGARAVNANATPAGTGVYLNTPPP